MQLDELKMLNKLQKSAKGMSTKVTDLAKKAMAVIQKRLSQAFNMIKSLGSKAWKGLLNFFGLEISNVRVSGGGTYPLL